MLEPVAANVIKSLVMKFVIRITSSWTCRPVSPNVLRAIKSPVNDRCVSVGVFRILNPEISIHMRLRSTASWFYGVSKFFPIKSRKFTAVSRLKHLPRSYSTGYKGLSLANIRDIRRAKSMKTIEKYISRVKYQGWSRVATFYVLKKKILSRLEGFVSRIVHGKIPWRERDFFREKK